MRLLAALLRAHAVGLEVDKDEARQGRSGFGRRVRVWGLGFRVVSTIESRNGQDYARCDLICVLEIRI